MENKIIKKLEKCRRLRGLPKNLSHRTFYEFGRFLQEMVYFLVFGVFSYEKDLKNFQMSLNREKLNAEDFNTYVDLFLEYWKNFERWNE
jgi:hypothetical protein